MGNSSYFRFDDDNKTKLYHKSLKYKTAYNEIMYKTYRNKLNHVLVKAEKDHYAKLLEANKRNMKNPEKHN